MATGKGAFLQLGTGAAGALVDWSDHIRAITPANEAEEVDGTVITSQKREFETTFERDRLTVRLKWSAEAVGLAQAAKGLVDVPYEYGPNGGETGKPMITGTCNVLRAQTIGGADPNALTELEVELNLNTEAHGTFPVLDALAGAGGRRR